MNYLSPDQPPSPVPAIPIIPMPLPVPSSKPFKIEAVVVCDGYHDFLSETLPTYKALFNNLVVVTSFEDKKTQRICEYHYVKCLKTDRIESRKGHFCKGAAINDGLAELDKDGWIVQLDADIALPPLFRQTIEAAQLDTSMIYGCDRFMVRSYEDWQRFRGLPKLLHEDGCWVHMTAFEVGTRVSIPSYGGQVILGFLQLWHADSGILKYPEGHTTAAREDTAFSNQWPRAKRGYMADIVVYHLESEQGHGVNWNGRKTKPFQIDGE